MTTKTIRIPKAQLKTAGLTSAQDRVMGQQETVRTAGLDRERLSVSTPLVVSTYNVRTLYQQGKAHELF